jgi:pimeloyl-ACP methyl ester carboxylesterase
MSSTGVAVLAVLAVLACVYGVLHFVARVVMFPAGTRTFGDVARRRSDVHVVREDGMRYIEKWAGIESEPGTWRAVLPSAIVIMLHGNAGTADDRMAYVDRLWPRGCMVVLPEYPGYGGEFAVLGQNVIVDNMVRIVEHVHMKHGWAWKGVRVPVVLVGRSLGSAVATLVAARCPKIVTKLVLVSPFPDMLSVAKKLVPAFARPFVRHFLPAEFDAAAAAARVYCPVDVIAASHDKLIPLRVSEEHARNFPDLRDFTVIHNTGHNDMDRVDGDTYWGAVERGVLGDAEN